LYQGAVKFLPVSLLSAVSAGRGVCLAARVAAAATRGTAVLPLAVFGGTEAALETLLLRATPGRIRSLPREHRSLRL
jgi:hypothetical protein